MDPILVNTIDIAAAGGGKGLLGDVDGDGRMELIFVQGDSGIDDRYVPHQAACVTAYRLDGSLLWQKGTPMEVPGNFGADFRRRCVILMRMAIWKCSVSWKENS